MAKGAVIVVAAGINNACFNWGITEGDVVRVVLLFYLMPLWTVVLARWVLHERISPAGGLRVALSAPDESAAAAVAGDAEPKAACA